MSKICQLVFNGCGNIHDQMNKSKLHIVTNNNMRDKDVHVNM